MGAERSLSRLSSGAPSPRGLASVAIDVTLAGTPMLLGGILLLVVSVIVHFGSKRKSDEIPNPSQVR
jgi:hypothetical protein